MSRAVPACLHAIGTAIVCLALLGACAAPAAAQDPVAQARQLASSGQRPAAIAILEGRLQARPDDLDARTLLGTILSWEGRRAEARKELRRVLDDRPGDYDAGVALASLELWDGRPALALSLADGLLRRHPKDGGLRLIKARALSAMNRNTEAIDELDRLLGADPADAPARQLRNRLADSRRHWSVGAGVAGDWFSDDRTPWQELWGRVERQTGVGAFSFTAMQAERWNERDEQYEFEAHPRLRPGTYLSVDAGWSPNATLYPEYRLGVCLNQALGRGFEASFGYTRLGFGDGVDIYVPSLSKYLGRWLLIGQLVITPNATGTDVTYHGAFRYYFRDRQYVGVRYHDGAAKERIETINDLLLIDAQGVSAESVFLVGRRLELTLRGGWEDQEQWWGATVQQYSAGAQLRVKF